MTWEFNDLTKNQDLPVYYKVYYSESTPEKELPYTKLITTEHTINSRNWVTHHNPHKFISENSTGEVSDVRAVGTDMTNFITINEKGEQIIIDNEHYDGRGLLSNLGNWMIDYIDNFNFVNRGDKKRTISVLMGHGRQGSLACFVRNSKLEIIEGTQTYTVYISESNSTLHTDDAIRDIFNYTFTINPHSVAQIYVEYNLLANSVGNVTHSVYLGGEEISEESGFQMINFSILNEIVIFSLQRFDPVLSIKNNIRVSFKEMIDLKDYCDTDLYKENTQYRLLGTINHIGNINYGHYYSYIRIGEIWYEFNDSIVQKVSRMDYDSSSVCVLFYEKINI